MEAPEKIYVRPRCFEAPWPPYVDENSNYGGIEYVQADAFIEKATKWLKENAANFVSKDNKGEPYLYRIGLADEFIKAMML